MVKHVLKNGTVLNDIQGHVVTRAQAPTVYKVLESIRKGEKVYGEQGKNESLSPNRSGK